MTKFFFAVALACCLSLMEPRADAQAQQSPTPTPAPTAVAGSGALFTPATQVQPGKLPFTLRKVFHRLAHDRTESMPFAETRTFAISRNPLRQNGTLRSSKEYGLSLSYESAKPHVIIVDDKGLIERQPDGHEREVTVADHPELGTLTDLYLNLLRRQRGQAIRLRRRVFHRHGAGLADGAGSARRQPGQARRQGGR